MKSGIYLRCRPMILHRYVPAVQRTLKYRLSSGVVDHKRLRSQNAAPPPLQKNLFYR